MIDSGGESLWAFILKAGKALGTQELNEELAGLCHTQGFDWFFYLRLNERTESGANKWSAMAHDCPPEWESQYLEQQYQTYDPLLALSSELRRGFGWKDVPKHKHLTRQELKVVNERADAGLCRGFSVPIHGPAGELALVSYASRDHKPASKWQEEVLALAAYRYHTKYESIDPPSAKGKVLALLTKREREILTWCAAGKSNGVIAEILGITESSVKFHLTNTYAKLSVSGRSQAIVVAITQGLIKP